ncbi:MAG: hypothetical protein KAT56_07420, partial [Sedimentisphaerales bacterium]|nr:hypothetical protein [Sedimentisphaerales bacterium]
MTTACGCRHLYSCHHSLQPRHRPLVLIIKIILRRLIPDTLSRLLGGCVPHNRTAGNPLDE